MRKIKIRQDKNLIDLAIMLSVDINQLSEVIIESGIRSNLFWDEECDYGMTILQHYEVQGLGPDMAINRIMAKGMDTDSESFMLAKKEADLILSLTTIGSGECPECGGECIEIDGDGKWTNSDSRESEPEYISYWQLLRCKNCDLQFKLYPA